MNYFKFLEELRLSKELEEEGYIKKRCPVCKGTGHLFISDVIEKCIKCEGRGIYWIPPLK